MCHLEQSNIIFCCFFLLFLIWSGVGWFDKLQNPMSSDLHTNSHELSVLTVAFTLMVMCPELHHLSFTNTSSLSSSSSSPPTALPCSVPPSRWSPSRVLLVSRSQAVCYSPSTPCHTRWVLPVCSYDRAGPFPQWWWATLYHPLVTWCSGQTQVPHLSSAWGGMLGLLQGKYSCVREPITFGPGLSIVWHGYV